MTIALAQELEFTTPPLKGPWPDRSANVDPRQQEQQEAADRFSALFARTFVHQVLRSAPDLVAEGPGKNVLQGLLEDTLADQVVGSGAIRIPPDTFSNLAPPRAPGFAERATFFHLEQSEFHSLGEKPHARSRD